ncbi:MAG TPA: hypothetical protein VHM16_07740 [Rubrobacteraceae bacterium]|nr:hypothetical protein [Rubrobacteraceae bacterium]
MSPALRGVRIGFIERRHPSGHRGAIARRLVPLLREMGARVDLIHAELGIHRLDAAPPWDLVVLKSGSAAALHLAAAAGGWGVPSVNTSEATRLAQDRLASAAILQRAGLPIAPAHLAWLGPGADMVDTTEQLAPIAAQPVIVKAARGSRGAGLWSAGPGELPSLAPVLPDGPYLIMQRVPHTGEDLKVFAAGEWVSAIERPFPAQSYEEKLGRPVEAPAEVVETAREAGRLLGLTCFGCDFVRGPEGWVLVDVNAFPGYKGAARAAEALAAEVGRFAAESIAR